MALVETARHAPSSVETVALAESIYNLVMDQAPGVALFPELSTKAYCNALALAGSGVSLGRVDIAQVVPAQFIRSH